MRSVLSAPSALAAALAALALGSVAVAEDKGAAKEARIQALADSWTAAYNAHDAGKLAALYTAEAHVYVHGQPSYVGRDSIKAFWAEDMKAGSPLTVFTVTHAVDGVDMKLVHGDYQVIDRNTGVPQGQGRFAHIWLAGPNGTWLLDRDLWNQPYTPVAGKE